MISGRVVGILEIGRRPYCGSLEETEQERGFVLFVPVDKKIPKVRIPPRPSPNYVHVIFMLLAS